MNSPTIPLMGFGTYGRNGDDGIAMIEHALEVGYRHLDTAQTYDTEDEVGRALRNSGLGRDEVFLTTKITSGNCQPGKLIPSLRESAETMGIESLDLTLIHWSVSPAGKLPMEAYLPELVQAQALGLTRLIGVSNFTIADLEEAKSLIGPGKIATNQFERHPLLRNQELVEFCGAHGIAVTCYLPLARGRCEGIPQIDEIAEAHGATSHQIALAVSLNEGHIVIPTSGKPARIEENFAARNIQLSADELARIATADRNERQINPVWSPAWD